MVSRCSAFFHEALHFFDRREEVCSSDVVPGHLEEVIFAVADHAVGRRPSRFTFDQMQIGEKLHPV